MPGGKTMENSKTKPEAESGESPNKPSKKPFDKKKWREKKYSIKYKVQQWDEKRKQAIIRNYYKDLKKDKSTVPLKLKDIGNPGGPVDKPKKKLSSFKAAQLEMQRLREEKAKQREENDKKKQEVKEALQKYKKMKAEKFKKLSKKTKKGQPLMSNRIELLYEKIKETADN